jgi:hypothetical protein
VPVARAIELGSIQLGGGIIAVMDESAQRITIVAVGQLHDLTLTQTPHGAFEFLDGFEAAPGQNRAAR